MAPSSDDGSNRIVRRWREASRRLKREVYALYLAYRDPRTPWYARVAAAAVVAYAFSPIDLIPDVIPVLGALDDLVIVPIGVLIAIRLIPPAVLAEARQNADEAMRTGKPVSRAGMVAVVVVWVLLAALAIYVLGSAVGRVTGAG